MNGNIIYRMIYIYIYIERERKRERERDLRKVLRQSQRRFMTFTFSPMWLSDQDFSSGGYPFLYYCKVSFRNKHEKISWSWTTLKIENSLFKDTICWLKITIFHKTYTPFHDYIYECTYTYTYVVVMANLTLTETRFVTEISLHVNSFILNRKSSDQNLHRFPDKSGKTVSINTFK